MSGVAFAAVVVIVLFAFAGGYVWGWVNGKAGVVQHPKTCRDRLDDERRAKEKWRGRAQQLEQKVNQLTRDLTWTGEFLLGELDKVGGRR